MDSALVFYLFMFFYAVEGSLSPTAAPSSVRSSQNNIKTYAGIGPSTAASGTGGPATSAAFDAPRTVVMDSTGVFYILESYSGCIRKVSTGNIVSAFVGICGTSSFTGDNGPASASTINFPVGMVLDTVGNFYFSDFYNCRARYVSTSGIISTIAGNGVATTTGMGGPATSASLNSPHGMWMSSTNSIYVTLYQESTVKVFTKGGTVLSVGGIFFVRFARSVCFYNCCRYWYFRISE